MTNRAIHHIQDIFNVLLDPELILVRGLVKYFTAVATE